MINIVYINKTIPAFIFPILYMDYIKTTRIDPVIIIYAFSSFLVNIVRSVHRKCVARQCIPYLLVRQNMKFKTMCL